MDNANTIFGVMVLFNPPADVGLKLARMEEGGLKMVVVYNEYDSVRLDKLRRECSANFICFENNDGLAKALNAGIAKARILGATHVILFDQDSAPTPDLADALERQLFAAELAGLQVAAIGPTPVDVKHVRKPNKPQRFEDGVKAWHRVQTLITSGSLLPIAAIDRVGVMWEELFIDAIDHEWCLRARHLGLEILQADEITMSHNLGDSGIEVFGIFKPVHRSPLRHYYILRNTLSLLRIPKIRLSWRLIQAAKTAYRIPIYILVSKDRKATVVAIAKALRDNRSLMATLPGNWYK